MSEERYLNFDCSGLSENRMNTPNNSNASTVDPVGDFESLPVAGVPEDNFMDYSSDANFPPVFFQNAATLPSNENTTFSGLNFVSDTVVVPDVVQQPGNQIVSEALALFYPKPASANITPQPKFEPIQEDKPSTHESANSLIYSMFNSRVQKNELKPRLCYSEKKRGRIDFSGLSDLLRTAECIESSASAKGPIVDRTDPLCYTEHKLFHGKNLRMVQALVPRSYLGIKKRAHDCGAYGCDQAVSLSEALLRILQQGIETDTIVLAGDNCKINCHRKILIERCQIFAGICNERIAHQEIDFSEYPFSAMLYFIRFLYGGSQVIISEQVPLESLGSIASYFNMDNLKDHLADTMITGQFHCFHKMCTVCKKNAAKYITLVMLHWNTHFQTLFLDWVFSDDFVSVWMASDFNSVPHDELKAIIAHHKSRVNTDNIISIVLKLQKVQLALLYPGMCTKYNARECLREIKAHCRDEFGESLDMLVRKLYSIGDEIANRLHQFVVEATHDAPHGQAFDLYQSLIPMKSANIPDWRAACEENLSRCDDVPNIMVLLKKGKFAKIASYGFESDRERRRPPRINNKILGFPRGEVTEKLEAVKRKLKIREQAANAKLQRERQLLANAAMRRRLDTYGRVKRPRPNAVEVLNPAVRQIAMTASTNGIRKFDLRGSKIPIHSSSSLNRYKSAPGFGRGTTPDINNHPASRMIRSETYTVSLSSANEE